MVRYLFAYVQQLATLNIKVSKFKNVQYKTNLKNEYNCTYVQYQVNERQTWQLPVFIDKFKLYTYRRQQATATMYLLTINMKLYQYAGLCQYEPYANDYWSEI